MANGWRTIGIGLLAITGVSTAATAAEDAEYVAEIEDYRVDRENRLRAPDGWLSLVGLFWLDRGANALGTDAALPIVLPVGPPRAGTLFLDGATVRLVAAPGVEMVLDGEGITDRVLTDDAADDPDVVELGRLRFHVIRRGDRFALRVKDPESPVRLEFKGLEYFPIDPAYRVTARFDAYDEPRAVQVAFTPHATCPLPPRGNRLAVAVRAGEKRYGDP